MHRKILLILLILTFSQSIIVCASDYSIPDIRIDVAITEDGIVHIDEHRTYKFEGSFSWADYRLPKEGFLNIRNIRVSEPGEAYINENTEVPGTFSVSESNSSVVIKWYYSAADEERTFTISYELTDAVVIGPEWTEFFWNYLASGRDKATDTFSIEIILPESISPDSLYAWSRGSESITIDKESGRYIVSATDIPSREPVIVRTLFPTSVFNSALAAVTDSNLTLQWAIQDEEAYVQRKQELAKRNAFYASVTGAVTLIIIFLSFGLFTLIYLKYGKRFSSKTVSSRETVVIPDRLKPAIIGRLMINRHTTVNHITATLFDLARRGWLTIHEEEKDKTWHSSKNSEFRIKRAGRNPNDKLEDWEKDLLYFVEKRIQAGKATFGKLFKDNGSDMTGWYSSWKKKVKKEFNEQEWIDKESYKGVYINLAVQMMLITASIFMVIMGTGFAFSGTIAAFLMITASAAIIRRTPQGEETYHRWKAYLQGLKNADKRTIRMEILDRHFIYATAFHLSEKQIVTLIESADNNSTLIFPWIYLTAGSSQNPASIAGSISKMSASGTSSFSGVSGGTGAMAGSAGGGASGGAG